MKIRTTNGELLSAVEALAKFAQVKMPGNLALKVMRLTRVLGAEVEVIEAIRQGVLERCVARDADGNPVPELDAQKRPLPNRVVLHDVQGYRKEVEDLFGGSVDVDVTPITIDEIQKLVDVEPGTLMGLAPFLTDV